MKSLFFLITLFLTIGVNAQIENYYVNKVCYNRWNEDMNAWTGWTQWEETKNYTSEQYVFSFDMVVSASVMKIKRFSGNFGSGLGTSETYTITLNQTSPVDGYTMYFNNSTVKNHYTYDAWGNKSSDLHGNAKVYSKQLNLASLLEGNASGNLTCYIDCPDGKFYMSLEISKTSLEELKQEQDEILELKREKQKQRNDDIKKIGESLKILLNKK